MKTLASTMIVLILGLTFVNEGQAKPKNHKPYRVAKKECLKENSSLAGKDLKSCIKNKKRR